MEKIRLSFIRLTAVLLVVGSFGYALPAVALDENVKDDIVRLQDEIRAKKSDVAQLEKKIATAKSSISRKRTEVLSLNNQIGIIDTRLDSVELDISSTELQIATVELELEEIQLQIDLKNAQIDKHKALLSELIRSMHREGERDYIEMLLSEESFSEFFSSLQYLEDIYADVGAQAKSLRSAKELLKAQEERIEEKQESLTELKTALGAKAEELSGQRVFKEELLDKTRDSEHLFQEMLSDLRIEYQQIEGEIQSIERSIRNRLEDSDELSADGDVILSWPTSGRYVTSYFHDPDYPYRHVFEHSGIDLRAGQGTPLRASAPGYVARAKRCSSSWCYSYVMIIHGEGISTLYGHMSSIAIQEDQFVGRGDIIGYSGGTPGTVGAGPFVTGPHLHFETRLNGIPVNPLNYLL